MARIRTIKPEFFTSGDIVALSPLARLFYIGLWCEADRDGKLKWDSVTLKLRYLPTDECDVKAIAQELKDQGLITPYEIDGKKYVAIPSFQNHQVINNRESESVIPDACKTRESGVQGEGRKEGKERKERALRETPLPKDFCLTDEIREWARSKGITHLESRFEHFTGAALAKGYKYIDWTQAFQNACRGDWAKLDGKAEVHSIFAGAI